MKDGEEDNKDEDDDDNSEDNFGRIRKGKSDGESEYWFDVSRAPGLVFQIRPSRDLCWKIRSWIICKTN